MWSAKKHKGFVSDKSQDEDYYVLTVAALARELEFRHITECEAVLAVGPAGSSGSVRRRRPSASTSCGMS